MYQIVKKEEIKKVAAVGFMEVFIICLMYTIVISLNYLKLADQRITKLVPFLSILLCVFFYLKVVDDGDIHDLGVNLPKGSVFLIIMFTVLAIIPGISKFIVLERFDLKKVNTFTQISGICYYFIVAFSEELFFRGYIKYKLRKMKKWKWILTSAVAFASLHFVSSEKMDIVLYLLLILFGIVLAVTYEYIKSIIPIVIFHMIWNYCAEFVSDYNNFGITLAVWIIMISVSYLYCKKYSRSRNMEKHLL